MQKIAVFIPGKPQGWQRAGRNGKHYYTQDATRASETEIGWEVKHQWKGPPSKNPFRIRIYVYLEPPVSWPEIKRDEALQGRAATVKPDNDNIEKGIYDALNGVAWLDDKQVVENYTVKGYGLKPGVRIIVEELEKCTIILPLHPL